MTSRGASADFLAEVAKAKHEPFHLFQGEWESGTVRFTDAARDVTQWGNTFSGVGSWIAFETIEESSDLQINSVKISLNCGTSSVISLILAERLGNAPLSIWRGYFDATGAVIADPVLIFKGRSDASQLTEDPDSGSASITITAVSHFVDFDRVAGRRTNHAEQQKLHPGDTCFRFVAALVEKVIKW